MGNPCWFVYLPVVRNLKQAAMIKLIVIFFCSLIAVEAMGQVANKPTIREIKRGDGNSEFEYKLKGKTYIISFKDLPNTRRDSLNVYLLKDIRIRVFTSTIITLDTLELEAVEKSNQNYVLIKTAGNRLTIHKLLFGKTIRLFQSI